MIEAKPRLTTRAAEILLAAVIIARSTSYLLMKLTLETMEPFNLLAVRFLLAFGILAALFWKRLIKVSFREVLGGAILGALFFAVMATQLFALKTTSSSTTSFLENTAVVFVPLLQAVLFRRMPTKKVLLCAILTASGVALLTLRGSLSMTFGELLCLFSAALYAVSIIVTDRLSRKFDPLMLGVLQVGFVGLLGLIAAFIFETPHLPSGGRQWAVMLSMAVVCSAFGFTLQPVAQSRATAEKAGLFCALNPLSAAALGALFLHETLGARGVLGAALILLGVVLSALPAAKKRDTAKHEYCHFEHRETMEKSPRYRHLTR